MWLVWTLHWALMYATSRDSFATFLQDFDLSNSFICWTSVIRGAQVRYCYMGTQGLEWKGEVSTFHLKWNIWAWSLTGVRGGQRRPCDHVESSCSSSESRSPQRNGEWFIENKVECNYLASIKGYAYNRIKAKRPIICTVFWGGNINK